MNNVKPSCFGFNFLAYSQNVLDQYVLNEGFVQIVTVNAEFIVTAYESTDDRFFQLLKKSVCTIDGQIPYWLVKIFGTNSRCVNKVSGSSYSTHLLNLCQRNGLKIFLLGGKEDSIKTILSSYPDRDLIDGYSPPFEQYPFAKVSNDEIRRRIVESRPDVILVGFGAPKQEFWIQDNAVFLENSGVRAAIGVGGTFEFLSGNLGRAPKVIQDIGLESLYRLIKEPSLFRLKRILKSLKVFLYIWEGRN